jgi:hypothetical protein
MYASSARRGPAERVVPSGRREPEHQAPAQAFGHGDMIARGGFRGVGVLADDGLDDPHVLGIGGGRAAALAEGGAGEQRQGVAEVAQRSA